ncbi:hypothetical protein SEUCBS140593_000434 [Sporothrix eucalyptigena]|uniref:Chromo domain-containing protein n=1 Tax=Sporothrix eucalyptigena TaxID=1812306 RepID=A0ABP0APU0_9PEZI
MPGTARSPSLQASPSPSSNLASTKKTPKKRTKQTKQPKTSKPAKPPPKASISAPVTVSVSEGDAEETADGDQSDEWFAIRDIVDEKIERRVRYYLVDWANHPVTGEVYPKSWIPAEDANDEAVRDWEEIKRARRLQNKAKSTPKSTPKTKIKVKKPTSAAKTAKPVAKAAAPPAEDSKSSYVNSSSAIASAESQELTPPPAASSSLSQEPSRKRQASVSEKETEGYAVQPPRKRRLVQGLRPDASRAFGKNNNNNNGNNSSSSQNQSQSQPLPSSPPATREQSIDESSEVALVAGIPAVVPVTTVDITPGPDFNPGEYTRLSQHSQLLQISRLALQSQGWMRPQSAVAVQRYQYYDSVYGSSSQDDNNSYPSSPSIQDSHTPPVVSGHTIPDSQQDEDSQALFVDQFENEGVDDILPTSEGVQPVVPAEEPVSHEPDTATATATASTTASATSSATARTTSGNAQLVPPPASSQNSQQLRASSDWASQDEPSVPRSRHHLSIQFLTQPEPDFHLFTQPSQSQPSQPGRPGQQDNHQTPASSGITGSNAFSAVSIVPDSTRPDRVAEQIPRPRTTFPFVYRAPEAIMDESPARPLPSSAADKLKQALQDPLETSNDDGAAGADGMSSLTDVDDPLVLAEIQRMQQESQDTSSGIDDPLVLAEIRRMEQESQGATASSVEDPLILAEIQRMQGLQGTPSDDSNVLPIAPPVDTTLPLLTEPTLQPAGPLLGPSDLLPTVAPDAMDASLLVPLVAVAPDAHDLLSQDPTIVPGAQHIGGAIDDVGNVHPGTIAMSDLSYADPMAPSGLDLSSEAEAEPEAEAEYRLTGLEGFAAGSANDVSDTGADIDADEDAEDNELEQTSSPVAMEEDPDEETQQDENDVDDDLPSLSNPNFTTNSYVVTLPLAANIRQNYIDLVVDKKTQQTIKDFSEVFSRDVYEVPDNESIAQVDELLRKLLDLSDLPPFFDSLPAMSPREMMKHAANTNSKFSFVYEFLDGIATLDRRVLILARKGVVLDYLEAVITGSGLAMERFHAGSYVRPATRNNGERSPPSFSVLLADTAEMTEALSARGTDNFPRPRDFDVVIGFDHTARTSGLIAHFLDDSASATDGIDDVQDNNGRSSRYQIPKPIALLLVSVLTLEHVDLRLELDSVDDLERKNALLLCTLESLTYLKDVPYDEAPSKPHQAAEAFAKMMADPTEVLDWEPTPLPDDVFDIYLHSSGPASQPAFTQDETINGGLARTRKRQLDDNQGGDETPKRARLHEATSPIVRESPVQYNDTIKQVLGSLGVNDSGIGPMASIPLAQLEALVAKVADLETQLQDKEGLNATLTERVHTLDRLLKGNTATINNCQVKLVEAVKERGVFEIERDAAVKEAAATKEKLESRKTTLVELRAEKKDLESRLAEANALAASSSQPDVAELGAARVALQEAQDKLASLERRATSSNQDLEFAQRAYQDASNAAAELSSENRDLHATVKELKHRADDNLRKIHETQNRQELEFYRLQYTEAATMLAERERELEYAREELRILKNGRRETRQQSVPRSPRLSVISPRTISGRGSSVGLGANGGSGGAASSSASASTPIPGMGGVPAGAGFAVAARQSVSRGNSPVSATFDAGVHNSFGAGGNGGGPPLPGMTYLNASQGGGRFGHLRD